MKTRWQELRGTVLRLLKVGFLDIDGSQLTTDRTLTIPDRSDTVATLTDVHHINWHYGDVTADADGATITFNMEVTDKHAVVLGGNRTLAVTNFHVGQVALILLQQDGMGSRTVTWFDGISWPGGTEPTLTTTADKMDAFNILCIATDTYLGFTAGLNF